jgi:hypothetical protein
MSTKQEFLDKYRAEILARYPWAENKDKLNRFMDGVSEAIHTTKARWNCDGEAVSAAWRGIGGKGAPTLKGLRALP